MPYLPDDVQRAFGLLGPRSAGDGAMGGLLGGGPGTGPMPLVRPDQVPQFNPPHMDDNRSWMQKLQMGLSDLPATLMPRPAGTDGLLSDEDLGRSRGRGILDFGLSLLGNAHGQGGGNAPSLGSAMLSAVGAGRKGYDDANTGAITGNFQGMQMRQQAHVLQARQAIGSYLSQNLGGDPASQMNALRQAYMMSAAVGDTETMKVLSQLLEKDTEQGAKEPQVIPAGGQTVLLDPRTHQPIGVIPHTAAPMSDDAKQYREAALQQARDNAAMRGDAQAAHRLDTQIAQEGQLTSAYEKATKPHEDAASALHTIDALKDQAMGGSGPAQQSLLMSYVKLQHPGLAVRPSEVHLYMGAASVPARIQRMFSNYKEGSVLSQEQMNAILHDVGRLRQEWQGRSTTIRGQYQERAKKYGLDPILRDPFEGMNAPAGGRTNGNPLMTP